MWESLVYQSVDLFFFTVLWGENVKERGSSVKRS